MEGGWGRTGGKQGWRCEHLFLSVGLVRGRLGRPSPNTSFLISIIHTIAKETLEPVKYTLNCWAWALPIPITLRSSVAAEAVMLGRAMPLSPAES